MMVIMIVIVLVVVVVVIVFPPQAASWNIVTEHGLSDRCFQSNE